jgi:hypothetical protein
VRLSIRNSKATKRGTIAIVSRWLKLKESLTERFYAEVTTGAAKWAVPVPHLGTGNSEIGAFRDGGPSRIQILMMNTHKVALASRNYSLPRSGTKPSLDAKLDRVFQMAEHVDARCVYMFDSAAQKRRPHLSSR